MRGGRSLRSTSEAWCLVSIRMAPGRWSTTGNDAGRLPAPNLMMLLERPYRQLAAAVVDRVPSGLPRSAVGRVGEVGACLARRVLAGTGAGVAGARLPAVRRSAGCRRTEGRSAKGHSRYGIGRCGRASGRAGEVLPFTAAALRDLVTFVLVGGRGVVGCGGGTSGHGLGSGGATTTIAGGG
jgi:hypothetical protein